MTMSVPADSQPGLSRVACAPDSEARRRWMAALALASLDDLEAAWMALSEQPDYRCLRGPDTGLVMVRGRAGGTGGAFNLGEMTVTRCTVEIDEARVGHAYVAGTSARHAELAALFDALMQDLERAPALEKSLIVPLIEKREERLRAQSARIASSKVEFFTVVRGENER